jgi:hypothetical protein
MRRVLLISLWGCLLAGVLQAAPPQCKTTEKDGNTYDICTRANVACEALAKEQVKDPSNKWNGCLWPVTIIKSHFTLGGNMVFSIYVSIVASYIDSERVDMTVTFERTDHTFFKYERKDVPIIIRDDIPNANADFWFTADGTVGVPTVEVTEKGGAREASHSYK